MKNGEKVVLALMGALTLFFAVQWRSSEAALTAAYARLAALEAMMTPEPAAFIDSADGDPVVATYDGGVVYRSDVADTYEMVMQWYTTYYGIDAAQASEMAKGIRQDIVNDEIDRRLVDRWLADQGENLLDEAEIQAIYAKADAEYETLIVEDADYYQLQGYGPTEAREKAMAELAARSYDRAAARSEYLAQAEREARVRKVVGDAVWPESYLQSYYEACVARDQAQYASDQAAYERAMMYDAESLTWHPAGIRAIRQLWIPFTEEQLLRLERYQNDRQKAETAEAVAEAEAAIDALYEACGDEVERVLAELREGANGETVAERYRARWVYDISDEAVCFVSENSTLWSESFWQTAMALSAIGEWSAPIRGDWGVQILQYEGDVVPGPVPLADIYDTMAAQAEAQWREEAYQSTLDAWRASANVTYYFDASE